MVYYKNKVGIMKTFLLILISFSVWANEYQRPDIIPYSLHNPYSKSKEVLGLKLFYSRLLDQKQTVYCGGCHDPNKGYEDNFSLSLGSGHIRAKRHSQSIINLAWAKHYFWDGRVKTLEEQVLLPIQSPYEMNISLKKLKARLNKSPKFKKLFEDAFPGEGITSKNISYALAVFVRGLVSYEAPFDRFIKGDLKAITDSAKRGFKLFRGKAKCHSCHSGWRFTDDNFYDVGIDSLDEGRGIYEENKKFAFKTPGLREISLRGPYMHNGSLQTLEDVIEFFNRGGNVKRKLDITPLNLTKKEKEDLEAFLLTLSSGETRIDVARELSNAKVEWLKWRRKELGY